MLTPTTSASPSRRAASSSSTWPGWSRSNTPLVKTTGPCRAPRQATASTSGPHLAAAARLTPGLAGAEERLERGRRDERRRHDHSSTAPNTSSLRTPDAPADVGEDEADFAARHHADPDDERGACGTQGAAHPAASLPTIAEHGEHQRHAQGRRATLGARGIQQREVDGGADADEEDRA